MAPYSRDGETAGGERSASTQAYVEIRRRILTLELPPGSGISEPSLSKDLGLSRTPVREAIGRLELEGLIRTENRRKYVYILRVHEIEEIFDIKKGVEGEIARAAAGRKEPEQARSLRGLLMEMDRFRGEQTFEFLSRDHTVVRAWLDLDRRFHTLLFAMAQNERAERIIAGLNDQWHRLELGLLAMEGRIERNITEHLAMGEAVLCGQGMRARDLMVDHLDRLAHAITSIMQVFHFPA